MDIVVFGGKGTKAITAKLEESGDHMINVLQSNEDISNGIVDLLSRRPVIDKLVLHSYALEGYDVDTMFAEIQDLHSKELNGVEIIFIANKQEHLEAFNLRFVLDTKCRGVLAKTLTYKTFKDILLNRFQHEEEIEQEPVKVSIIEPVKSKRNRLLGILPEKKVKAKKEVVTKVAKVVEKKEVVATQPKLDVKKNRIIFVTGDRKSGCSVTSAMIGLATARLGASTCIVDLDLYRKGIAHMFKNIMSLDSDEGFKYSLVNAIRNVHNCGSYLIEEESNLFYTTLSLAVSEYDEKLARVKYSNIKLLIQYLHTNFTTVIVDIPIDVLRDNPDLTAVASVILFCTNNTLKELYSSAKYLVPEFFTESDAEDGQLYYNLFRNKLRVLLTNYSPENELDGKELTVRRCGSLIDELCGFKTQYQVIGHVDRIKHLDNYIGNGKLASVPGLEQYIQRCLCEIYK